MNGCTNRSTWSPLPGRAGFWLRSGSATEYSTEQASREGAFGCQTNIGPNVGSGAAGVDSARQCGAPEAASIDCPVEITTRTCNTTTDKCQGTPPGVDFAAAGLTLGELANTCSTDADCNFISVPAAPNDCGTPAPGKLARCSGGVRDSEVCWMNEQPRPGTIGSCEVSYPDTREADARASCVPVSGPSPDFVPIATCLKPGATSGPNRSDDPDTDDNICTHSGGYQPRIDICPDPSDEFCGLIAYRITDRALNGSLDPTGPHPLPTDHTLGMYTPTFLGFSDAGVGAATFRYMSYYTPRPPRLAAPGTRNCAIPGQCPVSRVDAFAFNGQTDGVINVGGGSHKSTMRFYAWAAHNQMPLRQVVIDWGDGSTQRVDDTRMKNRKPFCGVQRECSLTPGLTCQTNADCPAGAGTCVAIGTCAQNANLSCSQDTDCTVGGVRDTCNIRTMFGNSTEACQSDYFDYAHLYTCGAQQTVRDATGLPSCTPPGFTSPPPRCSRDTNRTCTTPGSTSECAPGDICLEGLAPVGGCFDEEIRTCRFSPRVMIQDNFGWCTGECRAGLTGGQPDDVTVGPTASTVRHPNGGCWAGRTLGSSESNIRANDRAADSNATVGATILESTASECQELLPGAGVQSNLRPWVVYPGSLQLRESGELTP